MGRIYRPGLVDSDPIQGTGSNDTIITGSNPDKVSAGGGKDYVLGGDGDDTLRGGEDNDFLFGQSGSDSLTGGEGADIFFFGSPSEEIDIITDFRTGTDKIQVNGAEFGIGVTDFNRFSYDRSTGALFFDQTQIAKLQRNLSFDPSRDISIKIGIQGTTNNDNIIANSGNDVVSAKDGQDYVLGGNGNDVLNGGKGDDFLFGENGDDILNGNQDKNSLFGQSGSDTLTGGEGKDFLDGGTDADTLTGNRGADIFFFGSSSEGIDEITDFQTGIDKIQVDSIEFDIGATDFNRFSYDSSTGALSFDFFGDQTALTPFANLQPNLMFTPSNDIDIRVEYS